ncbi:Transposon Tf2-12 polyprotein [Sesamum angolense]|uniref:Transposon Tf2-12 polyprotein n=1 Tax=Sesamum angolense TaxID=2727404 RepID=A0AAE1TAV2_9LAMI|nr:Transposon Tf2-12 polyprotein [Sesamum angolense]
MLLARQGKISLEEDSAATNAIIIESGHVDDNKDSSIDEEGFDSKAFKLLIKAGHDPKENLSFGRLPPEATGKKLHGLNATQIMLKEKGHAIQDSRVGLGFTPPRPVRIAIKRVNNNYVSKGFSSTEDHKREENLRESVFNRLGPHRKELHGIVNRQSVFDRVLKAKAQTVIFTQVQSDDEDDKESVASSNYISNGAEENIVQTYHITLIEDGEVEEEDAKDAPVELEEGIKATIDEMKEVNLGDIENPRSIYVSASLTQEEEGTYIALLHEFKDVFVWSYKEIPGLDPKVAVHHLSVKKGARPVKQGHRRFRPELIPLIEGEVNKLIEVGFIREVKYPMWISSIVPVRKKNGQIRVCVDFRDLNNVCPKDDFPLPIPLPMIDAITGHEALSFMDGSFGYNQIHMAPADEELTVFRTPNGIYCYKVMPFGLKNASATYQRAMQKIFDDLLHKNVECYIDDLVMNPSKCAFGVTFGKFLRFIVRQQGIEIEQAKIDVILRMPKLRNIHELKNLQGNLAYLLRFISNLAGRRPLNVYIAAQERFAGILLAQKNDEGKENAFIHLVSKANPLKYVMAKPVLSDRLARWYLQLQKFEITYVPQNAVKGQVLADYLADHPMPVEWELSDDLPDEDVLMIEVTPPWKMYFNGASHKEGTGAGVVFVTSEGEVLPYSFTLTQIAQTMLRNIKL